MTRSFAAGVISSGYEYLHKGPLTFLTLLRNRTLNPNEHFFHNHKTESDPIVKKLTSKDNSILLLKSNKQSNIF